MLFRSGQLQGKRLRFKAAQAADILGLNQSVYINTIFNLCCLSDSQGEPVRDDRPESSKLMATERTEEEEEEEEETTEDESRNVE